MLRDHAPAASTTTSADTLAPSASVRPSTRPARDEIVLTARYSLTLAPAVSAARRSACASLRLSTWVSSGLHTAPASLPARCGSPPRVSAAGNPFSGHPRFFLDTN